MLELGSRNMFTIDMNEIFGSDLFPLLIIGLCAILIPIVIIGYTFSMKKSGFKNAAKLQNIGSEGTVILTETVLLGYKAINSLVFFYNHHFSRVSLSTHAITWSFFGLEKSRPFSEIEKVDIYPSSWLLFFFVPFVLIGSSSRVIVTFKGKQISLSFITHSSKQVVAVLKHLKSQRVPLTAAAEKYLMQNDAVV